MKALKLLFLLFIVVICLPSCKKKSKNPAVSFKLAQVDVSHSSSIQHYHIIYDAYNNVDTMIQIGGGTDTGSIFYRTFSYFTGGYTINDHNGNPPGVIATNAAALITGIYQQNDSITITYSGVEPQIFKEKVPSGNFPYYTTTEDDYIWAGGDIVSFTKFGGPTDSVVYDESKSGQIGDGIRISGFLGYGQAYLKTAHLPVQLNNGGTWREKFFYDYDGQNRIARFTRVVNNLGAGNDDTTIYAYQYYGF